MPLSNSQVQALGDAIERYDYPRVTYDFRAKRELKHPTMREVETTIKNDLVSKHLDSVKYGMANVVYWGHRRAGYQWFRVQRFINDVTEQQLREAMDSFHSMRGAGLGSIKRLRLREFSGMSFVSKLRMFLDPRQFVVLDQTLMELASAKTHTLFAKVKQHKTSVPITQPNERRYAEWSQLCVRGSETYFTGTGVIAVDIERGIYQLVNEDRLDIAAELVAQI